MSDSAYGASGSSPPTSTCRHCGDPIYFKPNTGTIIGAIAEVAAEHGAYVAGRAATDGGLWYHEVPEGEQSWGFDFGRLCNPHKVPADAWSGLKATPGGEVE
jgi:hypothetical protein